MRRLSILVVGLVTLVVAVFSTATGARGDNGAGDDPRSAAQGFVGSWRIEVAVPGAPSDPHLATFGADGTFVETARPVQPAPPDAPFDRVFPSPGHGAWVEAGEGVASLGFDRLLSDENGTQLGTVPASATLELDADGGGFSGELAFEVLDPSGAVVDAGRGTLTATRIEAEQAAPPTP